MSALKKIFCINLFLLLVGLPGISLGAYILNAGFGESGITLTGFDNYDDRAHTMALQEDGKIIVVGQSDNGSDTDFAVARYNRDGSLDTSFNGDGKAVFKIGSGDDGAYGVAPLNDGSIVVVGYSKVDKKKNIALIRLTSTGFIDLDFGIAGQVVHDLPGIIGEARDVVVDEEGNVYIGGTLKTTTKKWAIAARFLPDGSIDNDFGERGIRQIEAGDGTEANVVSVQSDGGVVLGGVKYTGTRPTLALFRLNSNGRVDSSFGTSGVVSLGDNGSASMANDLFVLEDNSIVAVGYTTENNKKNITTAKFLNSGELDKRFGSAGLSVSALEDDSEAFSLAQKTDGSFVIVGEAKNGKDSDVLLAYLDRNGNQVEDTILTAASEISPSGTQGNAGNEDELVATKAVVEPLLTDIDNDDDFGRSVLVLSDGNVFASGYTYNGNDEDFALINYADDVEQSYYAGFDEIIEPYLIATLSVASVNRNGAVTGGVITKNPRYNCASIDGGDCMPEIEERGVVFGIRIYPSYIMSTTETDTGTTNGENTTSDKDTGVFPKWTADTSYNYEVVRWGKTSDGSDMGTYGSDITDITPETLYYVRAYVKIKDGEDSKVLYGNQLSFKTDDACFIATAAYGSVLDSHVTVLRNFRDQYLKTNGLGRKFVGLYYHYSPDMAEFIAQSSFLKFIVRLILLPFVALSYFMLYTTFPVKMLTLVMAILTLTLSKKMLRRRQLRTYETL